MGDVHKLRNAKWEGGEGFCINFLGLALTTGRGRYQTLGKLRNIIFKHSPKKESVQTLFKLNVHDDNLKFLELPYFSTIIAGHDLALSIKTINWKCWFQFKFNFKIDKICETRTSLCFPTCILCSCSITDLTIIQLNCSTFLFSLWTLHCK